ncbi:hypothetical protein [Natranaerofaba carboxydovora]|uniref:hypothetical protein n=1 Tax=Natranaerofaba carboxydovora TaxID=2742683 RepID=UPI001F12D7F4|nr:hypothetical protein [Natranaerofaba carboxydovora]
MKNEDLIKKTVDPLLEFEFTEKVFVYQLERYLSIWVIIADFDLDKRRKLHYIFNRNVDPLYESGYKASLRVLSKNHNEINNVPVDAKIFVKGQCV